MKTNLYFVAGFYALPVRLRKGVGVPYHRAVEGRGGFVSTVTLYKALQTSWLWFWFAFLGGDGVRFEEHLWSYSLTNYGTFKTNLHC